MYQFVQSFTAEIVQGMFGGISQLGEEINFAIANALTRDELLGAISKSHRQISSPIPNGGNL